MSLIGILATIASLTIVVLGLPAQIVKNYRRKSCDGLAPSLVYSAFCTYTLWSLYGWTKPDWFLVVAQTPGFAISSILLVQLFLYRKRERMSLVGTIEAFLKTLYLADALYLTRTDYSAEERSVSGLFSVSQHQQYTNDPIEYVTAEQYIRCLSQLSYVLTSRLIQDGVGMFRSVNMEMFQRLTDKMWFQRSDILYLKNVKKGVDFKITLTLKNTGVRGRFSVCIFEIGGDVLKGELEFVAPIITFEHGVTP